MRYMGIDQSLTGTGVVIIENNVIIHQQLLTTKKTKNTKCPTIDYTRRLIILKNTIKELIVSFGIGMIAMEGIAFGAKGRAIFDIGGLSHLLREAFIELDKPFIIVPPATLKKFWTGKGNANKGDMINAAKDKGESITILEKDEFDNNIVDSLALCRLCVSIHKGKAKDFEQMVEASWMK